MNYRIYATRHATRGVIPSIITSIETKENGFLVSIEKKEVIFSERKLLEGFIQKNDIQQMKKGSSLILSITDIAYILFLMLFTAVSIIFQIVEPFPVPLISILLLVMAFLLCRFAVIVVKLKDGTTYCIPYCGSIFFKQTEDQEMMDIVSIIMKKST